MDKFSHVIIENLVIEKTCFSDTVTMQHHIESTSYYLEQPLFIIILRF